MTDLIGRVKRDVIEAATPRARQISPVAISATSIFLQNVEVAHGLQTVVRTDLIGAAPFLTIGELSFDPILAVLLGSALICFVWVFVLLVDITTHISRQQKEYKGQCEQGPSKIHNLALHIQILFRRFVGLFAKGNKKGGKSSLSKGNLLLSANTPVVDGFVNRPENVSPVVVNGGNLLSNYLGGRLRGFWLGLFGHKILSPIVDVDSGL